MVFQSAMNALNPVIDVRSQLVDAMRAHQPSMTRQERSARAAELLELVGVSTDRLRSFPHQLSGGMRQRVMIAMALALRPEARHHGRANHSARRGHPAADPGEAGGAELEFGFATVFITHDLSLLLEIADTIAIMYAGRIVEVAPRE